MQDQGDEVEEARGGEHGAASEDVGESPVGSSSAAAVRECAAIQPATAARASPRSVMSATMGAMARPSGSQNSAQTVT
ncbi:hypothetical protein SMD44_07651 [Streptomyces alboflavus]|uniref:Uncharacterized protein n=1 Tax=Streptomyces alboflavus TaxID=67267 RepID=A0A1Z1WP10_9ACTN|nr:hypothetical protein SMD44_07651 [Streptomyces alboflavus]